MFVRLLCLLVVVATFSSALKDLPFPIETYLYQCYTEVCLRDKNGCAACLPKKSYDFLSCLNPEQLSKCNAIFSRP